MKQYTKFYIDGDWVDPVAPTPFEVINPTTEEVFATVPLGNAQDVERAVAAARRAFPSFSATSREERLDLLDRMIAAFTAHEEEIAATITGEMGAPRSLKGQTGSALQNFRQAVETLKDYAFESRIGPHLVRHEAIGVCGLITAWNWPIQLLSIKLSSAIAAGCTTVIKPSEFTSISALVLVKALEEANLPKGVVNLVIGDGPTVGNAISSHPDVDMVSFTGSTRAGILVAEAAAPTVKRVAQELGGKSANIILPDADLAAAARWNIGRAFSNSGQSCHSPTRILVHESQREELLELLKAEVAKVRIGDPAAPETTMGPVVNKAQFDRIQGYIQTGLTEGGRLVCGGPGRPEGFDKGYYIRPTIFAEVTPDMTLAQEEIFGPVLVVIDYRDVDEAVDISNATPYGLGGYVFSADRDTAYDVGCRMRAGRVFYNGAGPSTAVPMGGYKKSGNGREMGVFGLEEYLEVKSMLGF